MSVYGAGAYSDYTYGAPPVALGSRGFGSYSYSRGAYGRTVIRDLASGTSSATSSLDANVSRIFLSGSDIAAVASLSSTADRLNDAAGSLSALASTVASVNRARNASGDISASASTASVANRIQSSGADIDSLLAVTCGTQTIVNGVGLCSAEVVASLAGLRARGVQGGANAALTVTINAREVWEPELVGPDDWTELTEGSDVWTPIPEGAEAWSKLNG